MSNTGNVIMAGSVGGATIVGMGLSTDTVQNAYYVKKIKDSASKFTKQVVSNIKSSGVGIYVKGVGEAAAATKAGGAAIKAGKAVGKTVGAAAGSTAVGVGADIIMGGMQIADTAQRNDSSGQKAYKITGDVIGVGANVGLGFIGPIGWAIMAVQILGSILDAAWDPFKNYFNSDLETMRLSIIDSLKVAYKEANMNYPIETKPDILASLSDPNSEESKEYTNIMNTYLADRGFITSEEVIAEEEYFLALQTIKRQRKLYRINENGELEMQDPDISAIALFDSATNNDLVMMALAGRYAKHKGRLNKSEEDLSDTAKINYIIGASVISTIFLIFFFLSIFIASI